MAKDAELTAYAATLEINSGAPVQGNKWEQALVSFFDELARLCRERPVLAIGHIKGYLELAGGAGSCYFSTTGSAKGTSAKGQLAGIASRGKLDFNILVYGIDKTTVEQITHQALQLLTGDLQATCTLHSLVNPAKQ